MGQLSVNRATPGITQQLRDQAIVEHNGRLAANNAMRKRERDKNVGNIQKLDQQRGSQEQAVFRNRENAGNPDNSKLKQLYYDQKTKRSERNLNRTKAQLDTQNRLYRAARPINEDPARLKKSLDAIPESKAFKDATHAARVRGAKIGGVGGAVLGAAGLGGLGLLANKRREEQETGMM